jgi:hypothetical protein
MIYSVNRIHATKQLVAAGKLNKRTIVDIKPTTVRDMSNEDYQDMVGPLFALLKKRAAK